MCDNPEHNHDKSFAPDERAMKEATDTIFDNLPDVVHGALLVRLPDGREGCFVLDDGMLSLMLGLATASMVAVGAENVDEALRQIVKDDPATPRGVIPPEAQSAATERELHALYL